LSEQRLVSSMFTKAAPKDVTCIKSKAYTAEISYTYQGYRTSNDTFSCQ
jgi:hypothetical protein